MFVLINAIISILLTLIDLIYDYPILQSLYGLIIFIPSLAVTIRRLHDTGKSGWWYLIILIPIIGFIWLVVLLATDSEHGPNQWGPDPKENELEDVATPI